MVRRATSFVGNDLPSDRFAICDNSATRCRPRVIYSPFVRQHRRNPFVDNVKALLARRAWTAPELARRAKISPKTLNNLLNGRHAPQLDVLEKIAAGLDLELWLLFLPHLPDDPNNVTFVHFVTHAVKLPAEPLERVADFVDFQLSRGR